MQRRRHAVRALKVALVGAMSVVLLGLLSVPASAAAPVTVSGKVACLNSASPDGMWINAVSGGSGFARLYLDVADGFGYMHYTYTLPRGGSYSVNVGCGGSPKTWGITAKSPVVSGRVNNFRCNDVNPVLKSAGDVVFGRIFGRWIKVFDLTQGVAYKTCKKF